MRLRHVSAWCVCLLLLGFSSATLAERGGNAAKPPKRAPQDLVVCTGWHALCSGSTDCQVNGDRVDCDCWRVNETHIVETSEIQDLAIKRLTETRCTNRHPCEIDEAPVCEAIRDGRYAVENVEYDWVSTFSYRGWCELYKPKACEPDEPDYVGDSIWAICDAAPCTETSNPADPDRPLSCQCRIREGAFVGTKDSCTGENGGIISAMPLSVWDFDNQTFTTPVPGYEYVQGACGALTSDPLSPP